LPVASEGCEHQVACGKSQRLSDASVLSIIMSACEHWSKLVSSGAYPKNELQEIHRSKISLHHAKTGYNYPTIRLPHTFLRLVGLSTRIYQTVQEGALAFLVVISSTEVPRKVPNRPSSRGRDRVFESHRAHLSFSNQT
jgi:hypothetical protein